MVADLEIKRNDQIASKDDYDVKAAELKRKIQATHIGEDIKEFVQQQHRTLKDAIDDDRRVYEDSCTKSVASLNQAYADGVAIVQEMNKQFTAGISERNAAAQAEIAATHKNAHAKIVTKLDLAQHSMSQKLDVVNEAVRHKIDEIHGVVKSESEGSINAIKRLEESHVNVKGSVEQLCRVFEGNRERAATEKNIKDLREEVKSWAKHSAEEFDYIKHSGIAGEAEIARLAEEIRECNAIIQDRDGKLLEQGDTLANARLQVESLKESLDYFDDKLKAAEQVIAGANIPDLQRAIQGKNRALSNLDKQMKILTAELNNLKLRDEQYKAQDDKLDRLVSSYAHVDSVIKMLQSGVLHQKPCEECPALKQRVSQLNEMIETESKNHTQAIKAVEREKQKALDNASAAGQANRDLATKHIHMSKQRDEMKSSRDLSIKERAESAARVSQLEAELSRLNMEHETRCKKLQTDHDATQEALVSKHAARLSQLDARMSRVGAEQQTRCKELQVDHDTAKERLISKHKTELDLKDQAIEKVNSELEKLTQEKDLAVQKQTDLAQQLKRQEAETASKKRKHNGSPESKTVQNWRIHHSAKVAEFQQNMVPQGSRNAWALIYETARCFPHEASVAHYENYLKSETSGWFCLTTLNYEGLAHAVELEDNGDKCGFCTMVNRVYCAQVSLIENGLVKVRLVT